MIAARSSDWARSPPPSPPRPRPGRRRSAKAINFGLIYGISAFGLARQLGIGRNDAQDYIERFFARYPGVRHFMDTTKAQAHERGYVETLFGRRLYLPNINARNQGLRQYAERTAINAPLQGTAADLIKKTMIDLQAWLGAEAPEIRMIMQVHDELVFEAHESEVEEVARLVEAAMRDVPTARMELRVPLEVEVGVGVVGASAGELARWLQQLLPRFITTICRLVANV